jgi:hypothetical protein
VHWSSRNIAAALTTAHGANARLNNYNAGHDRRTRVHDSAAMHAAHWQRLLTAMTCHKWACYSGLHPIQYPLVSLPTARHPAVQTC